MPATKRPDPIYQRGIFKLYARPGRNHEIVWYDEERKRERSVTAGTTSDAEATLALDREYIKAKGGCATCPTCSQPWPDTPPVLLLRAVLDYLLSKEGTPGYASSSTRLGHLSTYLAETGQSEILCTQVTPDWISAYRAWLATRPVINPAGVVTGLFSLGHQEGCVRALASAINAQSGGEAGFTALQPKDVSKSPAYRAQIEMLARMFNYCLRPSIRYERAYRPIHNFEKVEALARTQRTNLLRYLRMAVATWGRPDAILEAKRAGQWFPEARVFDLNPPGRRQTKKHRPKVVVARQYAPFLDDDDAYLDVATIDGVWAAMRKELGLPGGREAGPKLIRRSMSTLARKLIGEANWVQGQMMLGHVKFSVSDIYALPDPANLGLALAATESIIDEIEKLAPGAFYRNVTAAGAGIRLVK